MFRLIVKAILRETVDTKQAFDAKRYCRLYLMCDILYSQIYLSKVYSGGKHKQVSDSIKVCFTIKMSRYTRKCNFTYAHNKSAAFPPLIFTKLTAT
jgi:hypothetical protein